MIILLSDIYIAFRLLVSSSIILYTRSSARCLYIYIYNGYLRYTSRYTHDATKRMFVCVYCNDVRPEPEVFKVRRVRRPWLYIIIRRGMIAWAVGGARKHTDTHLL